MITPEEQKRLDEEECARQRKAFNLSPAAATGILECMGLSESQRDRIGDGCAHRQWVFHLTEKWAENQRDTFGFKGNIDGFAQYLFKREYPNKQG